MQQSILLGPDGRPIEYHKSVNLDPRFFYSGIGQGMITEETIKERPYENHVWTYACARAICWNVSRLRHMIIDKSTGEEIESHPVLDIISSPNSLLSESSFWQTVILYLLLQIKGFVGDSKGGQCFIVPWNTKLDMPVNLRKGEIPDELFPFPDSYFKPIYKKNNRGMSSVDGWKFKAGANAKEIDFENSELIRIQLMNPYDLLKGMSPGYASQVAISQDSKSDVYNMRLFDNDARVAGVLSTDQYVSQSQADEYLTRWNTRYGGPGNAGKIALIGNGLKYQQIALSKAEMQYNEQKENSREQILAAFGLNKIAVGLYENINHATIVEGRKMLWQDTYLPIDKIIWSAINTQWLQYVDNGRIYGKSDISEVGPLQPDYDKQATAMGKLVTQCDLPPVVAARIVGVRLTDRDIEEYPHLSEPPRKSSSVPLQDDSDSGKDDSKSVKTLRSLPIVKMGEDMTEKFWYKYIDTVADPSEALFKKKMTKFFISQRNRMQDNVDRWENINKGIDVNPMLFALDYKEEFEKLLKIYGPSVKDQLRFDEQLLLDELGELVSWGVTDAKIGQFVDMRIDILKSINDTTFKTVEDKVFEAIEAGNAEGLTVPEMAKRIKESIGDAFLIRDHHAKTIARTEMNSISSMARYDAFRIEGIDKHQWVTAMDEKVRDGDFSHRELNMQVRPMNMYFTRNGVSTNMKYPRQSGGAKGDIINCRCVAVAYFED